MGKFGQATRRIFTATDSRPKDDVTTRGHVLHNETTGLGGANDHSLPHFSEESGLTRPQADRLYRLSWAAAKMIDIPVDDMLVRWRKWADDADPGLCRDLDDLWLEYRGIEGLTAAMKAGRLFGTGMLIIVPTSGWETCAEAMPDKLGKDSLANLYAIDRWYAEVLNTQQDLAAPGFGLPYQYLISPQQGSGHARTDQNTEGQVAPAQFKVHHSWVLRFDGIRPTSTEGWWTGIQNRYWGRSELDRAADEVLRDAAMHAGVAHLASEASVFVVRTHGLKESLKGRPLPGEPTISELAKSISSLKSLYRTLFIDAEDEAERINVTFAGLPELMDKQAERLAAIADIPITRFLGRSPGGLNSTGESDRDNYAVRIGALQKRLLNAPVRLLDRVLCAHGGLPDPPEWEWQPLTDLGETEQSKLLSGRAEAILAAYQAGLLDEEEARDALPTDLFGELGPWTPPDDPMQMMAELELQQMQQNGATGRPRSPAAVDTGG